MQKTFQNRTRIKQIATKKILIYSNEKGINKNLFKPKQKPNKHKIKQFLKTDNS